MIDTSALAQRAHPVVHDRLSQFIEDGAAVCDMVVAESLVRAHSLSDFSARRAFFDVMSILPVDGEVWEAVSEIAEQLSSAGTVVATGDVVISACARVNDLRVVHYDSDYQTLGEVCDIDQEWIVAAGNL